MRSQFRALAWEELRVGGSIAAVVLAVTCIFQLALRVGFQSSRSEYDTLMFSVFFGPAALIFLLILQPNYGGHMTFGFSKRILRLPVAVSVATAVALLARTLIIVLVVWLSVSLANVLFEDAPDYKSLAVFTVLYLGVQLGDWLRAPLSGLSSAIVLALVAMFVFAVIRIQQGTELFGMTLFDRGWLASPSLWVTPVLALAISFPLAIPAVHAARVGRRIGMPEIWEWSRYLPRGSWIHPPFRSPVGAQMWFEFRRAGWILPAASIALTVLAMLGFWGDYWLRAAPLIDDAYFLDFVISVVPYLSILCAALAQSIQNSVAELRQPKSRIEFQFLRPLTDAEYAHARLWVNAVSLLPAMFFVLILQFGIQGRVYIVEMLPKALEIGVASHREAAIILLGRAIVIYIAGWALLSAMTRLGLLAGFVTVSICVVGMGIAEFFDAVYGGHVIMAIWIALLTVTVSAYVAALRRGAIRKRACIGWAATVALAAWLVFGIGVSHAPSPAALSRWYALALFACLGFASLVALPYVAVVLDVQRHRHGVLPQQDPSQHKLPEGRGLVSRQTAWVLAATLLATAGWLGWPNSPGFSALWKARGWPVTLSELDAWYPDVPADENAALKYLYVAERRARLFAEFNAQLGRDGKAWDPLILYHGRHDVESDEPIPLEIWRDTQRFRAQVSQRTSAALMEIAEQDLSSRYPIDLTHGHFVELDHLWSLRDLGRDLKIEALHASIAEDSLLTTQAIMAILSIADSLHNEPALISQLVRFSLLSMATESFEEALNRSVLKPSDLDRLQSRFAEALPPASEQRVLERAMVGEHARSSNLDLLTFIAFDDNYRPIEAVSAIPLSLLTTSPAAERVTMALAFETVHRPMSPSAVDLESREAQLERFIKESFWIAPLTQMLLPSMPRLHLSEWYYRTQLDLAATASAIERFRQDHGSLPEGLEQLVPEFISAIPLDVFSIDGQPIQYDRKSDGSMVVYSVGPDSDDDGGVEDQNWRYEGDLAFRVAPMSFRLGEQIVDTPVDDTEDTPK